MTIFYCKFLSESNGKRFLNIGQHLTKLLPKNVAGVYLTHTVYIHAQTCVIFIEDRQA